jgi:hypothetical protein
MTKLEWSKFHYFTAPACPHCRKPLSDSPDMDFAEGVTEIECPMCGKDAEVECRITTSYRARASAPREEPTPD